MEVNNKKTSKLILVQWRIVAVISVIVLVMLISFLMITSGLARNLTVNDLVYSYKINNNLNYKVNLNDNSFFDEKYLDMNKIYTSVLIKDIDTTFYYNYSNSTKMDLKYSYKITASIVGYYGEEDESVWTKDFVLLEPVYVDELDSNLVNINQPLNIDFNYYKGLADDFINQIKLSISAYLDVKMTVSLISTDETLSSEEVTQMIIPLTDSTFTIKSVYEEVDESTVFDTTTEEKPINSLKVIGGSILLVISIIVFTTTCRVLLSITKKSQYQIKLNKILKRYGEIIVEVESTINIDGLSIVDIKNMEDMIDIEEELHIPILYYEIQENEEGWFVINKGTQLFRLRIFSETNDTAISNNRYKRAKATKIVKKLAPVIETKKVEKNKVIKKKKQKK